MYPSPPMQPRPPALDTAAARGPPDVRAMPARRIGCLMLRRVVREVVMGPWDAMVAVLQLLMQYQYKKCMCISPPNCGSCVERSSRKE